MSVLPPSVVDALSDEEKRDFLLDLELELIGLITNPEKSIGAELQVPVDFMPNSYYRLLVHQFCQYYRLQTWTNRAGGISVAADPEIDYETLLEIAASLSVVLDGMGIQVERRKNETDNERPSMLVEVPENMRSGHLQRPKKQKFGRNRQNRGTSRDEHNFSHYGNLYGNYDSDYGNFGPRYWAGDLMETPPLYDIEQTQRYTNESDHLRSEFSEELKSEGTHTTDRPKEESGEISTHRFYRHFQFSPDAAPFYPSPAAYHQYDSSYYYLQYQGRTEREMLNNPYIILPADTRKRKDLKKRK